MPDDNHRLSPLDPKYWHADLEPIVDDMNGAPIHVHQLMAHNPALLKAWWNFRNHSVNGGTLGKRSGELVILRVAVHMQAWYEWASHVDRSLTCGITAKEIQCILTFPLDSHWQTADAALLTAVDELIQRHRITPATLARLEDHFTTEQVMDIIAIQGMYVILAGMINTWGLELDPNVHQRIEKHTCEHDFRTAAAEFAAVAGAGED
ncbi:carboxymuconolactone decarboxylase family protein [Pseudomaricurvus alkylphenolicus]|uniref:carboxymuconolactone decarboxylase family protein n=1 Tax=Pseudomaricurvus alkylphenolicus TaxID=1306991 RepID=UPI0014226A08|nr:carboxymuconolactone decarboxylase family protein [Pseudomaricurvus alkylphenolicus]